MGNLDVAARLIDEVRAAGVREFCVCAGSRNSPLLAVLGSSEARLFSFVDERSAAFFALGRTKLHGHPVAVVTTSGTAVAEMLPAAIEAYYSGAPLILISADRPAPVPRKRAGRSGRRDCSACTRRRRSRRGRARDRCTSTSNSTSRCWTQLRVAS